ncbi:MAG: hypothetical protein J6B67_05545 [Oscillospiraceae bacterium]|nr:hypothetical protein [Oscillospiraceae bacterium]
MKAPNEFISAVFCPPTGPWDGVPDRLSDRVFQTLKEIGVNRIFAYGMDDRPETVECTFRQCEKFDIGYLPCVPASGEYMRILPGDNGEKPFSELTNAEKDALDERFVQQIRCLASYPAFAGITFSDECGYLSFEGVAHAKRVFDKHFPGYEFHANFFSYSINDEIFWGGMAFHGHPGVLDAMELPFSLTGEMEIKFENRFRYYDRLVEGLLSKAPFEVISQDKYPFEEFWPTVPTSVHTALFELNAYFKLKSMKYGSRFYNFMQVGQWFRSGRKMTFGEMALQVNVTAAYGAAGFGWFPGVFPLDWRNEEAMEEGRNGGAAFIDIKGNPTQYASWVKALNDFTKPFAADLLESRLLGVASYGTYDNGFDWETVKTLPDAECIYHGELPDMLNYTEPGLTVQCSNQIMIATFCKNGKKRYYAVNLSSVYGNTVRLTLPRTGYKVQAMHGAYRADSMVETILQPGCALFIKED